MDRRTWLKRALTVSGGLLIPAGVMSLVGRNGVSSPPSLSGFNGRIMGTSYSVRLGTPPNKYDAQEHYAADLINSEELGSVSGRQLSNLAQGVHTTLLDVDRRMSTWRDSSEVSRFNNSVNQDWYKLSSATLGVISKSIRVSGISHGAFDVSVGPLVDLWGFGPAVNNAGLAFGHAKPSAKAIAQCMQCIGYNALELDQSQSAIRKHIPEARLDLSGIAKGFAVDKVADFLAAQGYQDYLVEVGGELRSRGQRLQNQSWRVAIERPYTAERDVLRVLNLNNCAIATSGDYRNFYVEGGERYSHSIDPRSGHPVNHELVSVTVIAKTTMLADAFSTALIIMGPDDAHAFAEQNQIAAHFVLKSATGKLDEVLSSSFSTYIS